MKVSRNNRQERLRKTEETRKHYSIRKLTVGISSVLIGMSFLAMGSVVRADENENKTAVSSEVVQTNETEVELELHETSADHREGQVESKPENDVENSSNKESTDQNIETKLPEDAKQPTESENITQVESKPEVNISQSKQETNTKAATVENPSIDQILGNDYKNLEDLMKDIESLDDAGIKITMPDEEKKFYSEEELNKYIQEEVARIKEQLKKYQEEKAEYDKKFAEYEEKRNAYIEELKKLGLWQDGAIDPEKLSQLLIIGSEDAKDVIVNILDPDNVQIGTGDKLGFLDKFVQVNADKIQGDFLEVIYQGLNNSYYGDKQIDKIVVTYSDWVQSNNPFQDKNTPGIYFGQNFTNGFFYVKADGVTVSFKLYDKDGNHIILDKNSAYITIGSLNSDGAGSDYVEKAELISGGSGLVLPESSVTVHGPDNKLIYSDVNNNLIHKDPTDKELAEAIDKFGQAIVDKYLGWDKDNSSKQIFGSGLFKVEGGEIKIRFSNALGSAWATFSTTIPKITFDGEKPEEPKLEVVHQKLALILGEETPDPDPLPIPDPDPEPTPTPDPSPIVPEQPGTGDTEETEEPKDEVVTEDSEDETPKPIVKKQASNKAAETQYIVSGDKKVNLSSMNLKKSGILPDTNTKESSTIVGIIGIIAGLLGLIGLSGQTKRKNKK